LSHLPAIVFTLLLLTLPPPPSSTLFPYTTLFRSLDEIGKVYGVTRERIRQIEKKTLEMLRHPSRSDALRDYARWLFGIPVRPTQDRKSTRLNSSHVKISYAVFCLKKKKQATQRTP